MRRSICRGFRTVTFKWRLHTVTGDDKKPPKSKINLFFAVHNTSPVYTNADIYQWERAFLCQPIYIDPHCKYGSFGPRAPPCCTNQFIQPSASPSALLKAPSRAFDQSSLPSYNHIHHPSSRSTQCPYLVMMLTK